MIVKSVEVVSSRCLESEVLGFILFYIILYLSLSRLSEVLNWCVADVYKVSSMV